MPRGGNRKGSGRPSLLSAEMAAHIRRDCEQRAEVLKREQAQKRLDRYLARKGLVRQEDGESDPIHQVPLNERPLVLDYGIHNPGKSPLPGEISEEARYAIDFLRKHRELFGAYSIPLPRLASGRQEIIAAVAQDWAVSERMVRTIWETKSDF